MFTNSSILHPEEVGHGIRHKVIIDFGHVMSEQLLRVISYLYRMSVQKASVVAVENSGGRVTKAHNGFSLVEKALIVDIRSALVAYLNCHYFLSRCS